MKLRELIIKAAAKDILEKLSELEHDRWISWIEEICKKENISQECRNEWQKNIVPYKDLNKKTKEGYRVWARKTIEFFTDWLYKIPFKLYNLPYEVDDTILNYSIDEEDEA